MRIFENEQELTCFIDKLIKNKKFMDLARVMQPLDVANALAGDRDIRPEDATKITAHLVVHLQDGMNSGPNIETNKNFPVPSSIRGDNMPDGEEEEEIVKASTMNGEDVEEAADNYINNIGQMSPDMKRWHFPADPRPSSNGDEDEDGWPYGDATKAGMDPKNQGHRRGFGPALTCVKEKEKKVNKYIFQSKPVFKQDLRVGQGGAAGNGLQQTTMSPDNSMPGGGSSWDRKGRPGWSSALGLFDLPDELPEETLESVSDTELGIEKNPTCGAPVPTFGSGRSDGGTFGGRRGFRRR
jgi:hypothetical protein